MLRIRWLGVRGYFRNSRIPMSFCSRNSRIPYYVILGLELRISIWNSRILCDEILGSSREMTQGLEILEFLGNFRIYSRNSSFKNSSLENFSLRNFRLGNSSFRNSRISISFCSRNSRIPYYVILGLELRISIWNSRIFCDESLGSSRGITQVRSG